MPGLIPCGKRSPRKGGRAVLHRWPWAISGRLCAARPGAKTSARRLCVADLGRGNQWWKRAPRYTVMGGRLRSDPGGQAGPVQRAGFCAFLPRFLEVCAAQIGPAEISALEIGAQQDRIAEIGSSENRILEIGIGE